VAAPFVFANKLRFDNVQPVPHYRQVSKDLLTMIVSTDRLFNMDLDGSGESGIIARYELGGDNIYVGTKSAFHPQTLPDLIKTLRDIKFSHLLIHSITPALREALAMELPENGSYLLKRKSDGSLATLKHWPYPKNFPVH